MMCGKHKDREAFPKIALTVGNIPHLQREAWRQHSHGHDIPHSNNIPHGHDIPHSNNIPHGDDIPQHPPTGQSELSSPGGVKVGLGGAESATPRKSGRDEEEEAAETLVALSCTPTKRIKPPDSTKHAATPAKHAPAAARSSDDRSTGVSPASGDTCRRSPRAVPLVAGADNADFARRVMEVVMPAMTDIIAGNRTRGLPPGGIVDATARAVERTVSLANLARVQSQAADAARRRVSPGGAHTSQQGNAVQDVSGTDSRSATGVHQPPGVGGRIDAQRNASAESEIERVTAQDRATEGAMNRDCRRAEKENKVEAGKMLEKSRKTSSRGKSRESWQKVDVDKFLSKLHYHE
ncbi:PREDICTED: uncharacterized protein LOC106808498 [Priapulus caudatus]|uniref:Uncharacterized protein LOC106808498 n=1 Tax=Priapulus caudatus TaxID=37621 RepID=A0ABM1E3F5_PRICU|nr:PREDICTED: uncharacterized protein LOC106808498 [Priapulus caudatus]